MNTLKDASSNEVSFVANSKYVKDIQDLNIKKIIVVPKKLINIVVGGK